MSISSTQIEIFIKNNTDKFDPNDSNDIASNQYYEMINKLISLSNENQYLFKSIIEGFVLYKFSMDDFISFTEYEDGSNIILDISESSVYNFLLQVNNNDIGTKESLKEQIKYYLGYDDVAVSLTVDDETFITLKSYNTEKELFLNNKYDSDIRKGGQYTDLYSNVLKNNDFELITPNITSLSLINFTTSSTSYNTFENAKAAYLNIINSMTNIDTRISNLKYKFIEFKNDYDIIPTLPNYPIRRILNRIKTNSFFLDYSSSDSYVNYKFLILILRKLYLGTSSQQITSYFDRLLNSNYELNSSYLTNLFYFLNNIGFSVDSEDRLTITNIVEDVQNESLILTLDSGSNMSDLYIGQTGAFKNSGGKMIYGKITGTDTDDNYVYIDISTMDYEELGLTTFTLHATDTALYISFDDIMLFVTTLISEIKTLYIPTESLGYGLYYNGNIDTTEADSLNGEIIADSEDSDTLKIYLNGEWLTLEEDIDLTINLDYYPGNYTTTTNANSAIATNVRDNQLVLIDGDTHIYNGTDWVNYSDIYNLFNITDTNLSTFDIYELMGKISFLDKIIRYLYSDVSRVSQHMPKIDSDSNTPHDNILLYFNEIYTLLEDVKTEILNSDNDFNYKS